MRPGRVSLEAKKKVLRHREGRGRRGTSRARWRSDKAKDQRAAIAFPAGAAACGLAFTGMPGKKIFCTPSTTTCSFGFSPDSAQQAPGMKTQYADCSQLDQQGHQGPEGDAAVLPQSQADRGIKPGGDGQE